MAPLITASAPGKVILMGEHAAVYGYPALVAALDLRTEATVELTSERSPSSGEHRIRVELPDFGAVVERPTSWMLDLHRRAKERWQLFDEGGADFAPPSSLLGSMVDSLRPRDAAAVFVQLAVVEALSVARPRAETALRCIRVRSAAPSGAGFGSSAAVATTVVAAVLGAVKAHDGLAVQLKGVAGDELVEGLALQVERLQHGRPSGVDTAAVRRGGVLRMERADGSDGEVPGKLVASPLEVPADALDPFSLIHTGRAAESTGTVVDAVRRLREADPQRVDLTLRRIGDCTEALAKALRAGATDEIAAVLQRSERLLEELAVVPGPVRALIRRLEGVGVAAKISGAGSLEGPGAGALLVYDPGAALSRMPSDEILGDLPEGRMLRTQFGAPGLHRESSGDGRVDRPPSTEPA